MANNLTVRVVSIKKELFNDQALIVSSKNVNGEFDIMPGHANFISLVENTPITVQKVDGENVQFNVPFAVIFHTNNQVNIYTDIPSISNLSK